MLRLHGAKMSSSCLRLIGGEGCHPVGEPMV